MITVRSRLALAGSILLAVTTASVSGAESGKRDAYLDAGGAHLYYEECGTGPAIVLLHDGLLHSVVWDSEWEPLCRSRHVVRYDRRGYGRSAAPTAGFLQTDDLAALLKHLAIDRATIVGCSSGSALAIDFAIHHPEAVEALVLVGPVVHGMPSSAFFDERGRKNSAPLERHDAHGAAENWSKDPFEILGSNPAARAKMREVLLANPQNLEYTGQFEIRYRSPAIERLSEIHAPTLLLVGEGDIPDVHAHAGAIQAGIWGSRRDVLPGAGHLVPLEKPEDLVARITAFVDGHRVATVPAAVLAPLAGRYRIWGNPAEVVVKDGRLFLRIPTEKEIPLFARGESRFFTMLWGETEIEFFRDAKGIVTHLDLTQNGSVQHCERIEGKT